MRRLLLTCCLIVSFSQCSKQALKTEPNDFENNVEALVEYYRWLVGESMSFYDANTGHFGQEKFAYRNTLNECYLRFDGYQMMQNTNIEHHQWIKETHEDILKYYRSIADTIGFGVWGFPTETKHPEFGQGFQYEIDANNSKNGWIYELSGEIGSKAGIYYVHGQILSDISKTYLRYRDSRLLRYIEEGANWIIEKNYNEGNVNYFAAALKGLSYAYEATKDDEIKAQAIVFLTKIIDEQNRDGSFGGWHDQEAGYHGITISCLAVARKYLPESELPSNFNSQLQKAMEYLKQLEDVSVEDRAAFVVQAWYYLSCLADDGLIPKFTPSEWNRFSESIQICIQKKQEIMSYKTDNNYFYQKGIQTFSLVGSTLSKYYYNYSYQYY